MTSYCWAEGSRAIEARREAAAMRRRKWERLEVQRVESMKLLWSLQAQLAALGVQPHG